LHRITKSNANFVYRYIKIFSANKKAPDNLVGPLKAAHVVEHAMKAALDLATDRLEGKIFQGSQEVPGDDIPVEDKASTAAEDELVSFVNDTNFESLVVRSQQVCHKVLHKHTNSSNDLTCFNCYLRGRPHAIIPPPNMSLRSRYGCCSLWHQESFVSTAGNCPQSSTMLLRL
jgi:hypothetical protein